MDKLCKISNNIKILTIKPTKTVNDFSVFIAEPFEQLLSNPQAQARERLANLAGIVRAGWQLTVYSKCLRYLVSLTHNHVA